MASYFKLVILGHQDWLFDQFKAGKVHYGWSGPGADLRRIQAIPRSERTPDERIAWQYGQFLVKRIRPGDRLVVQHDQPISQFLLAEVTGGYGFLDPPKEDFNHYLECSPLTSEYIDINSEIVPGHLRHDLTKRGHYYEIYPQNSLDHLDKVVDEELWDSPEAKRERTTESEVFATQAKVLDEAREIISRRWRAKDFEKFTALLLKEVPGVEVRTQSDTGKGWDLTIRILDPLTGETLEDDVPVQCKNYKNRVRTKKPLMDLKRSVENSSARLAYLFIFGDLDEEFLREVALLEQSLSEKAERDIRLRVVDGDRVAQLYAERLLNSTN